ncbi:flavodoxin domain-containing protein [Glaciecola siphonariae]|uniref:Flavodoxin domain-containing protein n=1 Tax=Glaciecola siphonariae TaxID=521012 RepID=A0ABV9LQK4_9ALTE
MNFEIIVGSVLGASEYVADSLEEKLVALGHHVNVHFQPSVDEVDFSNLLIVVTSTHGAGDLPDNIQSFEAALSQQTLPDSRFIVIGLGDSSYDTFCQGAITMEETFKKTGAVCISQPIHIDVLHHPVPEDEALLYLDKVLETL